MTKVTLPLYNLSDDHEELLDGVERQKRGPECDLCALSSTSPCVGAMADGAPGGLLVLGDLPTEDDARMRGRPFSGAVGKYIRRAMETNYPGPVAYDSAVRCRPAKIPTDTQMAKAANACRTFSAEIIEEAKPERIVIMGKWALQSLFGSSKYPRVSRGYQWLRFGGRDIPVFFLPRIQQTFGNKLLKRTWMADLKWALKATPDEPPWKAGTQMIQTEEEALAAVADIAESGCAIMDVETYGDAYESDFRVLCVSVGRVDSDETYTWDTRAWKDGDATVAPLLALLANPAIAKGGHGVKYDVTAMERYFDIEMRGKFVDTRLIHKVIDCTQQADLEACSYQVGSGGHKAEAYHYVQEAVKLIRKHRNRIRKKIESPTYGEAYAYATNELKLGHLLAHAVAMLEERPQKYAYAFMPADILHRYCAMDVVATARVWRAQWRDICRKENTDLKLVWDSLVQPATRTISRIEQNGMPVDVGALDDFRSFLLARETELLLQLSNHTVRYFPNGFNLKSTPQIQELLFQHLHLPIIKRTPTGNPSADKEVLEALKGHHDIIPLLLEHRTVTKLQGTYGDGLAAHVRPDGRIHCSFNIVGAETGRFSCLARGEPVSTSLGEKRVENVEVGDLVWTHRGRWRKVTRSWFVGVRDTYLVHLSNGETVRCTGNHRLLSADGQWEHVDERFKAMAGKPGQCGPSCGPVPGRGSALYGEGCGGDGDDVPERQRSYPPGVDQRGEIYAFIGSEIPGQDGGPQLHEGQNEGGASPVGGGVRRRPGISDVLARGEARVRASAGDDEGTWSLLPATPPGNSPYRRGHEEQRPRELGAMHKLRASEDPRSGVTVEAIHLGQGVGVFDLTVDEDESYASRGVFSHNCTSPNMQTIPSKGEYAKMAKNVFAARPGYKLVQFDFSQIELRVAAMISKDPRMRAIYIEGRDYHSETAALIAPNAYGVEFEKPTDQMWAEDPERAAFMKAIRDAAKVVNFGLIYGMGDAALAKATKTDPKRAAKMREAVMGNFRVLDVWTKKCVEIARLQGYVSTQWNGLPARRRYLWNIVLEGNSDYAGKQRSNAENGSYNSPIQGTASDYTLASLIAIDEWLQDDFVDAKIVMTVHDSIILEVADNSLHEVVPMVTSIMTGWPSEGVPLVVDCEVGQAWGALKSWDQWCAEAA